MKHQGKLLPFVLLFILLSFLLIFISRQGEQGGFFEQAIMPLQRATFQTFGVKNGEKKDLVSLREENRKLVTQLAKQKAIEKENHALQDQFQTTKIPSQDLLPAHVIGMNTFIPGESAVDQLTIDKGTSDGVKKGSIIVYKETILGRVSNVSTHLAIVDLLTNKTISLTAQTVKTSTLGVVRGQGEGGMILGNVDLSDKLEKGDIVVTKGDVDSKGSGYPPELVIGKIISVSKRASDLFQTAEVESLVDFANVTTVFVIKN